MVWSCEPRTMASESAEDDVVDASDDDVIDVSDDDDDVTAEVERRRRELRR